MRVKKLLTALENVADNECAPYTYYVSVTYTLEYLQYSVNTTYNNPDIDRGCD